MVLFCQLSVNLLNKYCIILYNIFFLLYSAVKNGDELMKKTKKEKKRLFVLSVSIIGLFCVLVYSVATTCPSILENKSKIKELNKEYNELLSNEEKLVSEVTKLQDDEYVARYAKEKFMYSEDGEIIIRMD